MELIPSVYATEKFAAGVQARINGSALLEGEDFTFNVALTLQGPMPFGAVSRPLAVPAFPFREKKCSAAVQYFALIHLVYSLRIG